MSSQSHRRVVDARPLSPFHWRLRRGHEESKRLGYEVSAVAVVHGAVCLGPDELVRRCFDRAGLGVETIAIVAFRASGHPCTIAVPTFRTWYRRDLQRRILTVAGEIAAVGRSLMLTAPHDVTAQPRLGNAVRMLRTMRPPAIGDACALLRFLESGSGEASLAQCEAILASPFAGERIFGLMAGGLVEIDLSLPISGESRVRLRSSDWPFAWVEACGKAPASATAPSPGHERPGLSTL